MAASQIQNTQAKSSESLDLSCVFPLLLFSFFAFFWKMIFRRQRMRNVLSWKKEKIFRQLLKIVAQ